MITSLHDDTNYINNRDEPIGLNDFLYTKLYITVSLVMFDNRQKNQRFIISIYDDISNFYNRDNPIQLDDFLYTKLYIAGILV